MYRSACYVYRGADKSLALPGRRQARKHVRDTRDFNNIETRAVIKFFFQGKAPKEIHAILTGTLDCFFSGRAKDLPAPLCVCTRNTWIMNVYMYIYVCIHIFMHVCKYACIQGVTGGKDQTSGGCSLC